MSRQQFLDLYCCLPHEFLIAYPQPRLSFNHQQKKKNIHRNTHALEPTSSSRLSKYKPKNVLHPHKISKDHYANDTHTSRRGLMNKIMSIESLDDEVEYYMVKESTGPVKQHHSSQMADGDKIHDDIIRPAPHKSICNDQSKQSSNLKSFKNPISHLSSSRIYQSKLPLNRTSTWRKLQANITPSHYNHIQEFQRQRQQQQTLLSVHQSIMLSPLNKQSQIENSETSKVISNITNSCTSLSSNPSTSLIDSNSNNQRINQSINEDQQILNDDDGDNSSHNITSDNEEKLLKNNPFTNVSVQNLPNPPSLQEIGNIEEFQPVIEILSPSQIPSDLLHNILSSFFPIISTPSSNNNPHMTKLLLIDQPPTLPSSSFIESGFISEHQQSKKVHSLFESIEELCLLIRKLLQHELAEQKITSLQATIANQLAILLTYLAVPRNEKIISSLLTKNTIERMTSTDEDEISPQQPLILTVGTQTDPEWTQIPKPMLVSSNNLHFHTELVSENKQEQILDIPPPSSSSQKVTSHTESMSTSVTLHLPGLRPNHARSDTFIYHIHHHQQYSSSYHHFNSFSDTTLHSLMHHCSIKEKTRHLFKRIGQKFEDYIELESSNTCLEASTEFTPDFLLTTINNSKYDENDQTEQFGIDTDKQDYQTDTISLILNKNQDKIDTLTFNSTEKENYDSLELDIEPDHEEQSLFNSFDIHQLNQPNTEQNEISKRSITEINNVFLNNTISASLNDDLVSPAINQFNNKKHFCQLFQPRLNTSQWQLPVLPRKSNSIDLIYEKRTAKIDFKHLKIRSNSNNGINIIGKRVRIQSNPSSEASTPTIKPYSSKEQSRKISALNYNNNYNEHVDSIQSLEFSTSIVDTRLSSTSIDSLCSLNSDTFDRNSPGQCTIQPKHLQLSMNHSESEKLILHSSLPNIHRNRDNLVETVSSSAIISSRFSDVTGKLDSNIALAQTLLNMLDLLNHNNNNNSSTIKIDVLHMYIRQFLIEFDARIRLDRKRRKNYRIFALICEGFTLHNYFGSDIAELF